METAAINASDVVRLQQFYPFPREQVFAAWTSAEAMAKWFGPQSHRCRIEKLDVREGGEYQFRLIPTGDMEDSDCGGDSCQDSVCAGQFVTVQPPEKLAMTFSWIENGGDVGNTLLTIELCEQEGGTQLILTHERLPTEDMRQAHAGGWQSSLECLDAYLNAGAD